MSQLDSLKKHSLVVADTGDIDAVARWKPQDATTNPSLLLAASQDARYAHLVDRDLDRLFVNFGREILTHIAGRVSTSIAFSVTRIGATPSAFQSSSGASPVSASAAPFATPTPRPPSSAGCAKADRASHSRNLPAAGASGTR